MYLYFNKQGQLKEVINDESLRQAGTTNKIYIYVEDTTALQITAKFRLPDGATQPPLIYTSTTKVSKKIPYNEKQDLKYFNYVDTWQFYEIPLSFEADGTQYNVLSQPGNAELTVRITKSISPLRVLVLGLIVFNIEETADGTNEIQDDEYITLAQFYYLLDNLYSKDYIDNYLYTKTDADSTFVGIANDQTITGAKILHPSDVDKNGLDIIYSNDDAFAFTLQPSISEHKYRFDLELSEPHNDKTITFPAKNGVLAVRGDIEDALTPIFVDSGETIEAAIDEYTGIRLELEENDINGLYIFTYANCMVMLPIYNPVEDTEYKVAACLCNSEGSYQVKVLTYLIEDNFIFIYNKENYIPTGYTAYLSKIKLY